MNTPLLQVVVGGQFGSEAKGHVAAQLAVRAESALTHPMVIRTGGPNAGHTVYDRSGQCYKLRQLPTAAVSTPRARMAIAAGSLIDPEVLNKEITETGLYADPGSLLIDPAATIIDQRHKLAEANTPSLANWSTRKGIGAARSDRVMRTAQTAGEFYPERATYSSSPIRIGSVAQKAAKALLLNIPVIVEAAQGYGLGLHTSFYPKTTSADCRAIDALADVGISPWQAGADDLLVWVVMRPYPIRVAGDSGPLQGETSWAELGLPEEHTTVTNKVRRVGHWDAELATAAIQANGGPSTRVVIALTMMDQVVPEVAGATNIQQLSEMNWQARTHLTEWIHRAQRTGAAVQAIGTGPATMVFCDDFEDQL